MEALQEQEFDLSFQRLPLVKNESNKRHTISKQIPEAIEAESPQAHTCVCTAQPCNPASPPNQALLGSLAAQLIG